MNEHMVIVPIICDVFAGVGGKKVLQWSNSGGMVSARGLVLMLL